MDTKKLIRFAPAAMLLTLAGCPFLPSIDLSLKPHLPCEVGPIILDRADVLTRATKEQIVALDETGAALCDWKPAK